MRLPYNFFIAASCFLFGLSLNACDYKTEPLPKQVISDYELAIPLADTMFRLADFFQSDSRSISLITISPTSPVILAVNFPTYLVDFDRRGYIVEWIEPKIFVNNAFTDKIAVSFCFYTRTTSGDTRILLENQTLLNGENNQLLLNRITGTDLPLSKIGTVYANITLTAKESGISNAELQQGSLGLKLGLKIRVRAGFAL